jgi:hypothetical protein
VKAGEGDVQITLTEPDRPDLVSARPGA